MKTALITGANRGLGLGHVKYCLQQGYQVIAAARRPESVAAFEALKQEYGERFERIALDCGCAESIAGLDKVLVGRSLDLVINNAGVCHDENLGEWTTGAFEETMRVNVTGPALIAQAALPCMGEGAKLINVSSGMGSLESNINPGNGFDAYAASKAALNILTRRLAEMLRPRGVVVIAMSPGWVRTDMGGEDAPETVEHAVAKMHMALQGFTLDNSGSFVSETGESIPW